MEVGARSVLLEPAVHFSQFFEKGSVAYDRNWEEYNINWQVITIGKGIGTMFGELTSGANRNL